MMDAVAARIVNTVLFIVIAFMDRRPLRVKGQLDSSPSSHGVSEYQDQR
jgi:hypothetical protein